MPEPEPARPSCPRAPRRAPDWRGPTALGGLAALALAAALAAPAAPPPAAAQAPAPSETPTLPAWTPGGVWRAVHAPRRSPLFPAAGTPQGLNAVHGVAGDDPPFAMAVGDRCAIATYDGATGLWTRDRSFEAQCDGVHVVDLRDVFVRAPDDIWVAARYTGGGGLERDCVAKTPANRDDVDYDEGCGLMAHWNGQRWRVLTTLEMRINRLAPPINAIDMVFDAEGGAWHGWAVGNDAAFDNLKGIILGFVDGPDGGKWQVTSAPNNNAVDLRDVHIFGPNEAWAVGEHGAEAWYNKIGDGPADWSRRGLSGPDHLYAIDMTDPLYGWDGGERGRMNHYDGNCHDPDPETACWFDNKAYPVQPTGGTPLTSIDIRGLDLVARGIGWLVATKADSRSVVARLSGDRWLPVAVVDDPAENLHAVFMASADIGWAVGAKGVILAYGPAAGGSPTPTATRTAAAATTAPPSPTPTPSAGATATPSATAADTATPGATAVAPTATPTPAPTDTPAASPTAEASPTAAATATPTGAPTASAAPSATGVRPGTAVIHLPFGLRMVRRR